MEPTFLRAFIDRWLLYTGHFGPPCILRRGHYPASFPGIPSFIILQNVIHLLHIIHGSRMVAKNFSSALPLPCIIIIIRHAPKKTQNIIDTKNLSILNTSQRTKQGSLGNEARHCLQQWPLWTAFTVAWIGIVNFGNVNVFLVCKLKLFDV